MFDIESLALLSEFHRPGLLSVAAIDMRLARETQRTQRNILERFREAHGEKRIYTTSLNGDRKLLLTRQHVQRIVNAKSDKPSAQRNLLKTLHAMFKWALAEDRVPDNPT